MHFRPDSTHGGTSILYVSARKSSHWDLAMDFGSCGEFMGKMGFCSIHIVALDGDAVLVV